jgi:uncharacterized protein YciI
MLRRIPLGRFAECEDVASVVCFLPSDDQGHRDYLDEAYQAGKLLISGPRIPSTGGVIIACVKTRERSPNL